MNIDRLDRIEALLERVAVLTEANAVAIQETRQVADSNAKTAQAILQTIQDDRAEREEEDSQLSVRINENGNQIQNLIEEARADRQEWRQQQQEANQRFENLLADARSDRLSHANRFQAMQEVLQNHLVEIQRLWSDVQRIWQRLAG